MSLLAMDTSTIMLALGLALLVSILLRRSYRYFGRVSGRNSTAIEEVPRPRDSPRQALDDAPAELLRWQVDMHETARDLKAELDTKASMIRQLLLMAAEQQEKLDQSIAKAEQLGVTRSGDTLAKITDAAAQQSSGSGHDVRRDALDGLSPTRAVPQGELSDFRQAVSKLADLGHTSAAIAQQLGLSIGDVEMLISLRSQH